MTRTARILKRLEWSAYQTGQGWGPMGSGGGGRQYPACPDCGGIKPGSGADREFMEEAIGHKPDCELAGNVEEKQ